MKEKLVNELIETFMKFKKLQMHNIFCNEDLSYNESYILHKLNKESSNVHLSIIRDKLKLAPSSITNLITSLEEKKYITRVIDKKDRRNIYIKITDEGKIYLNNIHNTFTNNIQKYIDYMSEEDIEEIIRIMNKTSEYFIKEEK